MKWYKQLPDNHPAIKPALDAFGWEGKGIMDKLTQLVQEIGLSFLDESVLKMNFGFNARKCNRIFPVLSECFRELLKEFGINHETSESFTKDSKVSESFTKLEGQNPRGRNKSIEEREEKKEETLRVSNPRQLRSTDEQRETAKWIFDKIRVMNPSQKEPCLDSWANDVRLMVEQDKRSLESIKELFSWVSKDPFWRTNILSPAKLREKWDTLTIKKNNPRPNHAYKPQGSYLPGNKIVPAEQRDEFSGDGRALKEYLARKREQANV